jgi:hypothetical protein
MNSELVISKEHPLRSAKWLWPNDRGYLYNHFAHFRKDFELDAVPSEAPLFISADQLYRLYINGVYVCRGPARGYQSHWPFDEVDISKYLQKGHNWFSVEAHNSGISTFSYIHETCAGFICAAEWKDFKLYSDESWLARRSKANKKDTDRYSIQLSFQEHLYGDELDRAWIESPEAPTNCEDRNLYNFNTPSAFIFGRSPYFSMEPRNIPMLREKIVMPEKVTGYASGKSREGYKDWKNVSWDFVDELTTVEWTSGSKINFSGNEVKIEATDKGCFRAIVLAMPEYCVASLRVEIENSNEGILDFHFSEGADGYRPAPAEAKDLGCQVAMSNRLFLGEKNISHEFFNYLGFRYITLVARDIAKPIKVKLSAMDVGYPFEMRGLFKCSDQNLNDIYKICKKTQQICALDAYVDTPWREQAQWWGDARVQARNTFYIDGDARLLKRGIRSIAAQKTPWGLTFGHAPTSAHSCILPDFSLTWILTLWDYYWQTGDIELFIEQWPSVQDVLGYFEREENVSQSGLLKHDRRLWYFGDWSTLFKGDVPSFLNIWYLLTLEKLIDMLKLSGMQKESSDISNKYEKHKKLVIEKLYDKDTKMFFDGLDENGNPVKRYSVHEQTLSIMQNLVPEAEDTMLEKALMPFIKMEEFDGAIPSAFWATYPFEVLGGKGFGKQVLEFIEEKWSPFLSTGTTWEDYEWHPGAGASSTHAWTSHPSYHFVNIILGIRQTAPAWKEISFEPLFVEGLDNAETLIPSPQGDIKAQWKRIENGSISVEISLPEGVKAKVKLPEIEKEISGAGEYKFTVE